MSVACHCRGLGEGVQPRIGHVRAVRTVRFAAAVCVLALSATAARADHRDPTAATSLAVVGSVAAVGLIVPALAFSRDEWPAQVGLLAAIEVMPSAGQFYAGNYASPGL